MSFVDPDQFIIARKRKKYRFAIFANQPACFELEDWTRRAVDCLEVGAGTGLFSVELAAKYPEKSFVAVDVKADRLQKGAKQAESRGLANVWFVRARADQLSEIVEPGSAESIWLTFPDPFPKNRSAGRRLTHPTFLRKYAETLRPSSGSQQGGILLKHDNPEFFEWSLEQLVTEGWCLKELSFDLHQSNLADDYKILTTYEQRWLSEGRITQLVRAVASSREFQR